MKLLFIIAVMYFAIPMMTPEAPSQAPSETPYAYRSIVADKAVQEKTLTRLTSALSSALIEGSAGLATSAYNGAKNAVISGASEMAESLVGRLSGDAFELKFGPQETRGLASLGMTCDPSKVEGEPVYDLERSITMLFNVLPKNRDLDSALDPSLDVAIENKIAALRS